MTPPSNAGGEGREVLAREVLAEVGDERAGVHIHPVDYIAKRIAATYGYQPCMSGDARDRLNSRQRRNVQELAEELYAAMLAFSNREHATPRSMPEEVVEALATRDRKAGECPDKLLDPDKACPRCGALSNEGCRITIIADARFVDAVRNLIAGASA